MNTFDKMAEGWTEAQWMQHSFNAQTMCLGGRLSHTLTNGQNLTATSSTPEWLHLQAAIREHTAMPYISIQQWNDTPGRTFAEILEMVALASLRWDLEHSPASAMLADASV